MFFTQEDLDKIKSYLVSGAVKDTDFAGAVLPFSGEELVPIIQNNHNVTASIKAFLNSGTENKTDLLNVSEKYGEYNLTLAQAIALVPGSDRKLGMIITFNESPTVWGIYQFLGTNIDYWNDTTKWEDIKEKLLLYADEEDLTEVEEGDKKILKFKDKEYDSSIFSGKGRMYLRKSIVGPINYLDISIVNKANTIYHIQYDFNLNGQVWEVPEGCILLFEGGSLTNGIIKGNNTMIISKEYCILPSITIQGTWNIPVVYSKWVFGNSKTSDSIQIYLSNLMAFAGNNTIKINEGDITVLWPNGTSLIKVPSNTVLDFTGTSITIDPSSVRYKSFIEINGASNVAVVNLNVVGNYSSNPSTNLDSIGLYINQSKSVTIHNCTISKFPRSAVYISGTSESISDNITIDNLTSLGSYVGVVSSFVNRLYIRDSNIQAVVEGENNHAINCPITGSPNIGSLSVDNCTLAGTNALNSIASFDTVSISKTYLTGSTNISSCNDLTIDNSDIQTLKIGGVFNKISNNRIGGPIYIFGNGNYEIVSNAITASSQLISSNSSSIILISPTVGSNNINIRDCYIKMPNDAAEGSTIVSAENGSIAFNCNFYNSILEDSRASSSIRIDCASFYNCNIKTNRFIYGTTNSISHNIVSCYIENSPATNVEFLLLSNIPGNNQNPGLNISGNEILYPVKDEFIKIAPSIDVSGSWIIFKNNSIPFEELNNIYDVISTFGSFTFYNQPSFRSRLVGTTSEMPTLTTKDAGYKYFDTTRGLSLVWDGTTWINPDGTKMSKVLFV